MENGGTLNHKVDLYRELLEVFPRDSVKVKRSRGTRC